MCNFAPGELAEWSIAAVLKTVEPKGSGGSNPLLSAGIEGKKTKTTEILTFRWFFVFTKVQINAS